MALSLSQIEQYAKLADKYWWINSQSFKDYINKTWQAAWINNFYNQINKEITNYYNSQKNNNQNSWTNNQNSWTNINTWNKTPVFDTSWSDNKNKITWDNSWNISWNNQWNWDLTTDSKWNQVTPWWVIDTPAKNNNQYNNQSYTNTQTNTDKYWWLSEEEYKKQADLAPSAEYTKLYDKFLWLQNYQWWVEWLKKMANQQFWSVEKFHQNYVDWLNSKVKSWQITQYEANKLWNALATHLWLQSTISWWVWPLESKDKNLWSIQYQTWTDSEWNATYSSIDLNQIKNQVAETIFDNPVFQADFNKYIDAITDQMNAQKSILESKNAQIQAMYNSMNSEFKWKYAWMYDTINRLESETQKKFWDLENETKSYFEDFSKTLWSQSAREKSLLWSQQKAMWLSDAFVQNSVSEIDDKYQERLSAKQANYIESMRSLADSYLSMSQSLNQNKASLTDSELQFSKYINEKSEELTNELHKFDSEAIDKIYKPLTDVLSEKYWKWKDAEVAQTWRQATQAAYQNSNEWERQQMLYNYLWIMAENWVDVSKLKEEYLIEASTRDNIWLALGYLIERMWWDASDANKVLEAWWWWTSSSWSKLGTDTQPYSNNNTPKSDDITDSWWTNDWTFKLSDSQKQALIDAWMNPNDIDESRITDQAYYDSLLNYYKTWWYSPDDRKEWEFPNYMDDVLRQAMKDAWFSDDKINKTEVKSSEHYKELLDSALKIPTKSNPNDAEQYTQANYWWKELWLTWSSLTSFNSLPQWTRSILTSYWQDLISNMSQWTYNDFKKWIDKQPADVQQIWQAMINNVISPVHKNYVSMVQRISDKTWVDANQVNDFIMWTKVYYDKPFNANNWYWYKHWQEFTWRENELYDKIIAAVKKWKL